MMKICVILAKKFFAGTLFLALAGTLFAQVSENSENSEISEISEISENSEPSTVPAEAAVPVTAEDFEFPQDRVPADEIAELRSRAESGDAEAQFDLAECYFFGIEIEKNLDTAFDWYKKSAEQNYVPAQYKLGTAFRFSEKISRPEILRYLYRAACSGDADSQFALGVCYYEGNCANWDFAEAVAWFKKAAAQGHVRAALFLGYCYTWGLGVPADSEEGVWWFQEASFAGDAKAQYYLGEAYRLGRGVEKDLEVARVCYRLAAENGHRYSKLMLERLGEKIKIDDKKQEPKADPAETRER